MLEFILFFAIVICVGLLSSVFFLKRAIKASKTSTGYPMIRNTKKGLVFLDNVPTSIEQNLGVGFE